MYKYNCPFFKPNGLVKFFSTIKTAVLITDDTIYFKQLNIEIVYGTVFDYPF